MLAVADDEQPEKENILVVRPTARRRLKPNCAFCRHQLMGYMSSVWVYIVILPLNI